MESLMWGKFKENGVWKVKRKSNKLLLKGHDSLYVAAGFWRLRIMKVFLTAVLLTALSGCAAYYPAGPSVYHNAVLQKHLNNFQPSPGFKYYHYRRAYYYRPYYPRY